jgi:hypothetical protein
MKLLKNNFVTFLKIVVLLLSISTIFFSCSSNKKDEPTPNKSYLYVVQVAPGPHEFYFRINGQQFSKSSLAYENVLPYLQISPGKQEFSVSLKQDDQIFFKSAVDVSKDQFYTAFITSMQDLPVKPLLVITQDDVTPPTIDKAKIRLVNLSPNVGSVDLSISGKAPLFTKLPFRGATAFAEISPGEAISFDIKENLSPDILATRANVRIEKGKIYTLFVKGLKGGITANTKLALDILNNDQ